MKIDPYFFLTVIFLAFFFLWFFLHIQDRRRVLNGLAFFISMASLVLIFTVLGFHKDIDLLKALVGLIFIAFFVAFPLSYITGLFLLFSTGMKVIKKEGLSLSHLLSILLAVGIIASSILYPILLAFVDNIWLLTLMNFFIIIFSYFVLGFLIYLTSAILYRLWYERRDKDYLIVLGAGIRKDKVTPLLAARLDVAINFYKEQKKRAKYYPPKIIVSGGQGEDEIISEALAMKNYCLEKKVAEKDILLEDKSRNTRENLLYSAAIIKEHSHQENPKVLFATSNYHVLRAGILAKNLGLDYNGLGAKTKFYFSVSAFIREYIGVIYFYRKANLFFAILISIIFIINFLISQHI